MDNTTILLLVALAMALSGLTLWLFRKSDRN
jgi:LPXTG-motif cell wall-anchored protein